MAEARSKRARRAVLRGDELPSLAPTTHRIVPSEEEMLMWIEDTSIVIDAGLPDGICIARADHGQDATSWPTVLEVPGFDYCGERSALLPARLWGDYVESSLEVSNPEFFLEISTTPGAKATLA